MHALFSDSSKKSLKTRSSCSTPQNELGLLACHGLIAPFWLHRLALDVCERAREGWFRSLSKISTSSRSASFELPILLPLALLPREREREPFEMQSCVCLVSLIPEAGSNDRRHLDRHLGPARRNVDLPRVAPRRFFDSLPQRSSHHREHTQRCSWKLVLRCTSCITAQVVIGGEPKRTAFSETSETCVHGAGKWCMTRVDCDDLPNSNVQSNNQSSLLTHRERRALTVPDFRSRASSHVEQIAVSPSINFRKSHTAFLLSVARWHPRM